jgi:hypothetical protein
MKKIILIIPIILFSSAGLLSGQVQSAAPASLERLFIRLRSATEDSVRLRINDSVRVIIDGYANSDSVFSNAFRDVRNLGQILSPDRQVKIITWNVVLDNDSGRYFCYFIKKGVNGAANSIYALDKKYDPRPIATDTTCAQSDWYGALYYDIRPYKASGKQCYVLLGINYSDPMVTRKVIDVLIFTSSNYLIFGLKWFNTGKGTYFRHVFEYASNGVMSLRFSSSNSIVFDHLVPVPTLANEGRILYGSDYSFDGYLLKNGIWNLTLNIDARNNKQK